MKIHSINPNKGQQQHISNKFEKESMDHQPHPVQKHFVNQQHLATNNNTSEDQNEFQLEQYYEQMQALQNQEQIGKFSQKQLYQQQINQANSNTSQQSQNHQIQQSHQKQQQLQKNNINPQQQNQKMFKQQQQLKQQFQLDSQQQQQSYDKRVEHFHSSEYSSDDLQDENNIEGMEDEHLYENQQLVQFANHLGTNGQLQSSQNNNQSQGSNLNQNSNTNNSFSSADEVIKSTDETIIKEELKEVDKLWAKQLIQDSDKYFEKIIEMNDIAAQKLSDGQQKEALAILYRAEKMLEFAASCGKVIDRNLIIVVLYNRACAYQSLWILDKCSKYIDGVIYNLEMSLREEDQAENIDEIQGNMSDSKKQQQNVKNTKKKFQDRELLAYKIKKQTFLVKSYLQCCAILSQQGLQDVNQFFILQ